MAISSMVVIGEAQDDCHLLMSLGLKLGVPAPRPRPPIVMDGNSDGKLSKALGAAIKTGSELIFVVLDADRPPHGGVVATWGRMRTVLEAHGAQVPEDFPAGGLVLDQLRFAESSHRLAVWIFPDNIGDGAMEDFVVDTLIPNEDDLFPHARQVVATLARQPFPKHYVRKAEVRTWLAWQRRPGAPPGAAVTEGILPLDPIRLKRFEGWLRRALA